MAELLSSGLPVRYVVGTVELLSDLPATKAPVYAAVGERLADAMNAKNPQALVAVAQQPEPSTLGNLQSGAVLALVEITDPGNAGTMIRTAEAAGMAGVALVGDCVDTWNPKLVRASAGAVLRLPVVRLSSNELFAGERHPVVATVVNNGENFAATDLSSAVICVGNEAHGLSASFVARCDIAVTIPLAGPTESLNVAAAAAVLAFSALSQRPTTTLPS